MTVVGIFGILIGLLGYFFAFARRSGLKVVVFLMLFAVQLAATFVYFAWAQVNVSDALGYYDHLDFLAYEGFRPGTQFVVILVQFLKHDLGATYLDCFLLFHNFGLFAVLMLMRTFEEIFLELGRPQPIYTYLLLFVPSLHFWTVSIGKDGPLVLGCALMVWATMNIRKRWIALGVALAVMVLFRPHIGLLALIALAGALLLDRRLSFGAKLGLGSFIAIGGVVAMATVQSAFSVVVTDAESLGNFWETQAESARSYDTGRAMHGASFPLRFVSLLFRPFFFDADGLFGLVASFENLLMVFVIGSLLFHARTAVRVTRGVLFLRFAVIFTAIIILMLALVYYNVGLGLRQRSMILPSLLVFFIAIWTMRPGAAANAVPRPA